MKLILLFCLLFLYYYLYSYGINVSVVPSDNGGTSLTHSPKDVIEQFISHPGSFLAFLEENYLAHFSCPNDVDMAASALSDSDFMLAEWRVG